MGNWIRQRYFFFYLPRYIPITKIQNVLEGGCGQGHYTRKVATIFSHTDILAVDIGTFNEWKNPPTNVEFRSVDLMTLNEEGTRDFIYSIDVLEHIRGNKTVIERFFGALRPGGYLYLAVPCEEAERYYLPKSWFGDFYKWADEEHVGEMRRLPELVSLLRETGFSILISRHTFTFFGHIAWEIEFLLHHKTWGKKVNLLLMPVFKMLGWLDIVLPIGPGNNLVIAVKPTNPT